MNHPTWDTKHAQILTEMWPNYSASYIANHLNKTFGTHYTRNAVIGKAGRMKLEKPKHERIGVLRPLKQTRRDKPARVKAPKRFVMVKPDVPDYRPPRIVVPEEAWNPLPDTVPINIVQLNRKTCRWPVDTDGDTEQMFCGAPCSSTYCKSHARLGKSPYALSKSDFLRNMRRYL
ncbi:MAG: hypothetical protein AMJ72_02665 [Acidithiobacillales bacterium SM1_46]|nr:MAG: hypothetical protein AMJ72_02665 [Acidithiobacillales bacterium SM1_46]